jgi:O-antigen ligase
MDEDDDRVELPRPETVLLAGFLIVLAWAPFPYGSNRPWAELVLGLGLGAILFAWAGAAMTGVALATPLTRRLTWPALLMFGAIGWAAFQSLDLSLLSQAVDLKWLAHPVWQMTSNALGFGAGAFVSVDPELTRQGIFAAGLSIAAFVIAFELGRDRARAGMLLGGFVVIAFVYALGAIASFHSQFDFQSWLMPDAKPESGRMAGPFINPNHFATFLALGALAGLGLFVETLRQSVVWDRGGKVLARTMATALTGKNALLFAAAVVVLSALLFTQSRGGVIAFLIGTVALIVALGVGKRWNSGEESGQRAMAALLVAVLGVAAALSADPLFGRVGAEGVNDSARAALAQSTIEAIAAAPLTGHGFGAYERYYPFFADGSVVGYVDEAHNDLLETLADLGLPAGAAFIASPILLAGMCFAGCLRRRRDRVYPAVGFAASVVVGVHAAVDFSLQVPAVAIAYAALLGLGTAQSWRTNMDMVR